MFGKSVNSHQCHLFYKGIMKARLDDPMVQFFYEDLQKMIHSQYHELEVRKFKFSGSKVALHQS
jgi:hypothetical protein